MNLSIVKKNNDDMRNISIRTGLMMFAGFVVYFLLMYALGFAHRSEFRVFNGVIQIFFIYKAIQMYFNIHPEYSSNYLNGVEQGIRASAIGVGAFAIFMTLFLYLNPSLMEGIKQNSMMGKHLNPFNTTFIIITEGIVISLIISYIITRILESRINRE